MRLSLDRDDTLTKLHCFAEHNGKKIQFNIGAYDRKLFEEYDVFEHINQYWSLCSAQKQDQIFECYKGFEAIFEAGLERDPLADALIEQIQKIQLLHPLSDMEYFLSMKAHNYFIPDVFEKEYKESTDRPGSREQTYIIDDYVKLVSLIMCLRPLIPIWGEYISRTRQDSGTLFKEYYAYKLLYGSQLAECDGIQKLIVYIQRALVNEKQTTAAIIRGISTEDYPIWILSLVLVRKLCVADIRGMDSRNTIITLLYRFIAMKIKGTENSFNSTIKEKQFNESASDDSNLSRLESYKLRHELTPGDIVILEYSLRDPMDVAKRLAPTISEQLVYDSLHGCQKLYEINITDMHLTLLQWVFKPVMSPRGIMYLSKSTIIQCLGVCQAVLIHRGHYVLAGLSAATYSQSDGSMTITGVDSRARIPKEMLEKINQIYPFDRRAGSRNKVRTQNQVMVAMDQFADSIAKHSWLLTAPEAYWPMMNAGYNSRRFAIPHEMKVLIAAFIIEIGTRSWKL